MFIAPSTKSGENTTCLDKSVVTQWEVVNSGMKFLVNNCWLILNGLMFILFLSDIFYTYICCCFFFWGRPYIQCVHTIRSNLESVNLLYKLFQYHSVPSLSAYLFTKNQCILAFIAFIACSLLSAAAYSSTAIQFTLILISFLYCCFTSAHLIATRNCGWKTNCMQ